MIKRVRLGRIIFLSLSAAVFSLFCLGSWFAYTLLNSVLTEHMDEFFNNTVKGIRQTIETSVTLAGNNYLRAVAEQHLATVSSLYQRSLTGEISMERARQESYSRLAANTTGNLGNTFVSDSLGVLKIYPTAFPHTGGTKEWQFVREQFNGKKGFFEYKWPSPEEAVPRKKLLYIDYFQPWDWIITVTAAKEELAQLSSTGYFFGDIKPIKVVERGYAFVIDMDGRVLAHPAFVGSVLDAGNEYRSLYPQMSASRKGKMLYDWIDPSTGKVRTKIVVFETIEDFSWMVVAAGYVDDFYKPLETFKRVFIALLCGGLLLALCISFTLNRSISAHLRSLLNQVTVGNGFSAAINPSDAGGNQIEELADQLCRYVEQLNERNAKLRDLLQQQERVSVDLSIYKEVFENIVEGLTITDSDGTIIRANPAFEKITGYSLQEVLGNNPRILKSEKHPPEFYEEMWAMLRENGFWTGEIWNRRKNGEIYSEWLTISAVRDKSGNVNNFAAVYSDIINLANQSETVKFLAYYDQLTELPNRRLIKEKLGQMISECKRKGERLICLVCDLDNFKTINDSLGHEQGDQLLNLFVERLRPVLRLEDTLGRIGSDEFVVLAKTGDSFAKNAISISERIFSACLEPVQLGEQLIYLTMSIGIAFYPDDAVEGEDLFKRATLALNNDTFSKGNDIRFFNTSMEKEIQNKIKYLGKIREGLANNEFIPFYQPKVDLKFGTVCGMEALARWMSNGRLIPPIDFISVAEDSGLIIEMSRQIYEKAFRDTATFIEHGHRLKLAVNLSPIQLQSASFLEDLIILQQKSGLAAKYVELEMTESTLFENTNEVQLLLDSIVKAGFSIAIDDFGTGYSSLHSLKQLPLTTLKVDMSFVSGIGKNRDDEQLVRTIALLAKQFGLRIVAEGVEEQGQVDFLRLLDCDEGQGYYFAKPMSREDFGSWLATSEAIVL